MDGDGGGDGLGDLVEAVVDVADDLPGGWWSVFIVLVLVGAVLWVVLV